MREIKLAHVLRILIHNILSRETFASAFFLHAHLHKVRSDRQNEAVVLLPAFFLPQMFAETYLSVPFFAVIRESVQADGCYFVPDSDQRAEPGSADEI